MKETASELGETRAWDMRWNRSMAFSALVHLLHSAAIFVLTWFVSAPAGPVMRYLWCIGAFFSVTILLLLLRIGSYEGTTEEEVGRLIRQGYWVATTIYLSLLAASLYFIFIRHHG